MCMMSMYMTVFSSAALADGDARSRWTYNILVLNSRRFSVISCVCTDDAYLHTVASEVQTGASRHHV